MLNGTFREHTAIGDAPQFLRFYENGYVIGCTINDVQDAPAWFDWPHDAVQRGRYQLEGDDLSFETFSPAGSILYRGQISGRAINLHVRSLINDHERDAIFNAV